MVLLPLMPAELAPLPYSTQIDPPPIVMLSGALLPVGAVAKMSWSSTTGVLPKTATVLMTAFQPLNVVAIQLCLGHQRVCVMIVAGRRMIARLGANAGPSHGPYRTIIE